MSDDEQGALFETTSTHYGAKVVRDLDDVPMAPADPTPAEAAGAEAIEPKRASDAGEILARLRRGPATSVELVGICLRYGSRLFDLRQLGHEIKTERRPGRVFVYTLVRETGLRTRDEAGQ